MLNLLWLSDYIHFTIKYLSQQKSRQWLFGTKLLSGPMLTYPFDVFKTNVNGIESNGVENQTIFVDKLLEYVICTLSESSFKLQCVDCHVATAPQLTEAHDGIACGERAGHLFALVSHQRVSRGAKLCSVLDWLLVFIGHWGSKGKNLDGHIMTSWYGNAFSITVPP